MTATVRAPTPMGPPIVKLGDTPVWRVEPFGRGWRLAARRSLSGEVLAWYTGHWIRSGGSLLVAPDRDYAVHSVPWRRLDLQLRERRSTLLDVHAVPLSKAKCRVECALLSAPSHVEDADLLVTLMSVLALLVHRQGHRLRSYGGSAT